MVTNLVDNLFSNLKAEKKQTSIKPERLPKNYFKSVSEEIRKIKKQIEKSDPNSEETQKLKENLNNIKSIFKDLMLIRLQKMLNCIILQNRENLNIINEEELEEEEKIIYKILNRAISAYIKDIVNKLLEGEIPNEEALLKIFSSEEEVIKKKVKNKKMILITTEFLPKILAPGGKTYGPFFRNDIVILPNTLAERLIRGGQNIAEEI